MSNNQNRVHVEIIREKHSGRERFQTSENELRQISSKEDGVELKKLSQKTEKSKTMTKKCKQSHGTRRM